MKIKTSILLLSFLGCLIPHQISLAQYGWYLQSTGTDRPLNKIYFIDQNFGWASASSGYSFASTGRFMRTTNGGITWSVTLNNSIGYSSFHFLNQNAGWLIGNFWNDIGGRGRYIFKTTNGGINWITQLQDSQIHPFYDVFFADNNTGWVVGGSTVSGPVILKTTNSGLNWFSISIPSAMALKSVFFVDQNTGWVCDMYFGMILKTTDSGNNWFIQASYSPKALYSLFFFNLNTGWVVGSQGLIAKTINSGINWLEQNSGNTDALRSIIFKNENTGWCCGDDGKILCTTNAGNTWLLQRMDSLHFLNSITFVNNSTGWAAGGIIYQFITNPEILKTTTGGLTFLNPHSEQTPETFTLYQNFPNPFNPVTKIRFSLPRPSEGGEQSVRMVIYDILGQEIEIIVNRSLRPSSYEVDWDASNHSSGVYFYRLTAGEYAETRKMVLLK